MAKLRYFWLWALLLGLAASLGACTEDPDHPPPVRNIPAIPEPEPDPDTCGNLWAETQVLDENAYIIGVGVNTDKLAALSPTLQGNFVELEEDGWEIISTDAPGAWADLTYKLIVIGEDFQGCPTTLVFVLAHETGHALHPYTDDLRTREKYMNDMLDGEGAATLNSIKVQREILDNGGPKVGAAWDGPNFVEYNKIYDQYLIDGNAATAYRAIGAIFAEREITSTTGQTYAEYYGSWYDEMYRLRSRRLVRPMANMAKATGATDTTAQEEGYDEEFLQQLRNIQRPMRALHIP